MKIKSILQEDFYKYSLDLYKTITNGYADASYSQEGEDMILKRLFENKKNGFYVDIGAHHPFRYSNTYYFYKKGWRGINIDGTPGVMKKFNKYRKRDVNLEIAISDQEDVKEYHLLNEPALNGFAGDKIDKYLDGDNAYKLISKTLVQSNRLEAVLRNHDVEDIDFMNIDVEGHEVEVIKSNDWDRFRPKYILVEIQDHNILHINGDEVTNQLNDYGYKPFCKTPYTVFFKRQDA